VPKRCSRSLDLWGSRPQIGARRRTGRTA